MHTLRVLMALLVLAALSSLSGGATLRAESAGLVSGRVVNAVGRPLAGLRVELIEALRGRPVGVALRVNLTDARGAWSFGDVPAGGYVVRMVDGERITGVPVHVSEASVVAGVTIVAPSLAAPRPLRQSQTAAAAAGSGGSTLVAPIVGLAVWAAGTTATVTAIVRPDAS